MDGSDIKLDRDQRGRAAMVEIQIVSDPEWAASAIIWQRDRIAALEAENERLRKGIVWAVRSAAEYYEPSGFLAWDGFDERGQVYVDGSDAGLLEAVLRAMKGGE